MKDKDDTPPENPRVGVKITFEIARSWDPSQVAAFFLESTFIDQINPKRQPAGPPEGGSPELDLDKWPPAVARRKNGTSRSRMQRQF